MVLWRDGATPMADLAAKTLRDRTTVTRLVDRLVGKRLVVRKSAARDRRRVVISVSAQGRAIEASVLQAMEPLIKDANRGIADNDMEIALRVLVKMARNLSPPDPAKQG